MQQALILAAAGADAGSQIYQCSLVLPAEHQVCKVSWNYQRASGIVKEVCGLNGDMSYHINVLGKCARSFEWNTKTQEHDSLYDSMFKRQQLVDWRLERVC